MQVSTYLDTIFWIWRSGSISVANPVIAAFEPHVDEYFRFLNNRKKKNLPHNNYDTVMGSFVASFNLLENIIFY